MSKLLTEHEVAARGKLLDLIILYNRNLLAASSDDERVELLNIQIDIGCRIIAAVLFSLGERREVLAPAILEKMRKYIIDDCKTLAAIVGDQFVQLPDRETRQ